MHSYRSMYQRMLRLSETSFEINGIEITFREILASVVIMLAMLILGTVISGGIEQTTMERKQEYATAIDISSENQFAYGIRTDVGRAFCYGTLSAVDMVSDNQIGGSYMYIYREEQHYNMHTYAVVHTDGNGNTYTTTEIYYSWDYAGSDTWHSQVVHFLGKDFDYGQIDMPSSEYLTTKYRGSSVRFEYYIRPVEYTGTMYATLTGHTIQDAAFHDGTDIDQTRELLMSGADGWTVIFWILWIILTVAAVFGFCTLENDWLR